MLLHHSKFAPGGEWKWMLYGDDDTVFFLDNVVALLETLDWRQPYLLSDSLWWPEGGSGTEIFYHKIYCTLRTLVIN